MKKELPEIIIKVVLAVAELLFVGILGYYRLLNIGWIFIIFGLGLLVWVLAHLVLMVAFIVGIKLHVFDILLYLAIHASYLVAWLFQYDGGDSGDTYWTIQQVYRIPALDPFLKTYGETILNYALLACFICYTLIAVLLVVRFVKFVRSRRKNPEPVPAV